MNQTYELNNNVDHIIQYIKNSILWGPSSVDHSDNFDRLHDHNYAGWFDDNFDDDDDDPFTDYYKQPRTLELINNLLNSHSTFSRFIRDRIIKWYQRKHLYDKPRFNLDENVLSNFIKVNVTTINKEVIEYMEYTKKQIIEYQERKKRQAIEKQERRKRERIERREQGLQAAHEELNRLLNLKMQKSKTKFYANNVFRDWNIHPEDMTKLWREYNERWIPPTQRGKPQPQRPRPTIAYDDTFEDKLIKYLKTHSDERHPMSFDDFQKLTRGWPSSFTSIEDWYQTYIEKHPSNIAPEKIQVNSIGFKSPKKVKALKSKYPNIKSPDSFPEGTLQSKSTTSYFPLKQNKKLYQLHKVCPKKTYIIDIMFCDKYAYLIAINVNTRFLYAAPMNKPVFTTTNHDNQEQHYMRYSKNADTYINALDSLIKSGMDVRYLQGDGEKAFDAHETWAYYDSHNIEFKPVPRMKMGVYPDFMKKEQKQSKTDPMHGSLGILDRVIRTLRDMAYHIEVGIITPNIMKELVNQYNNVPHATLSKYVGFDVTPQMVQDDEEIENYIIRQIMKENEKVTSRAGFKLENGTPVKLYNEKDSMAKRRSIIQPGKYHIVDYHGGYYEVEDENKNRQFIPRFKLAIDI